MDLDKIEAELLKNPFNFELRLKYANILLEKERFEDALQQFLILDNHTHSNPELKLRICNIYMNKGDLQNAQKYYQQAKSLGIPDDFDEIEELEENNPNTGGSRKVKAVFFSEIAGMEVLKKIVSLKIIEPFKNSHLFKKFKKESGGGVLLYGPPGCGKTMLAKAIATECNADFIGLGLSDILNMWIGESEKNLSRVFEAARNSKPSVLFIDELDALAFSRSKAKNENTRTVVNEFLNQLDGVDTDNEGILILAATNMPWDVDPAMKRPGRFSRIIFVPPPDEKARLAIFESKLKDVPTKDLDYKILASKTKNYSGADIDGVIEIAKERAIDEIIQTGKERELLMEDFLHGIEESTPSTLEWLNTAKNLVKYGDPDNFYKDVKSYLKENKLL